MVSEPLYVVFGDVLECVECGKENQRHQKDCSSYIGDSMKAVFYRGLPGSGKTTAARQLVEDFIANRDLAPEEDPYAGVSIVSADDYFEGPDGEYLFDPKLIAQAHADCLQRYIAAIARGDDLVVVHNTFTQNWELDNYLLIARGADYDIEIVEIHINSVAQLRVCYERCVHKVPASAFGEMVMRWEHIEGATIQLMGGL